MAASLVECPVCLEAYDAEDRVPHVSHCGHNVCRQCLGEVLARCKCPICNVDLRGEAAPTNFELRDLIISFQEAQQTNCKRRKLNPEVLEKSSLNTSTLPEFPFADLKVIKRLGRDRGGFAVCDVQLVRILSTNEEAAAKFFHCPDLSLSQLIISKFLQEAETHFKMKHQNVVTLYGACTDEPGKICLLMEYCEKGSLYDVLQSGIPLNWATKARMAQDLIRAINYLHQRFKIIHQDIKSLNFLVTESLTIKICNNFGISKARQVLEMRDSARSRIMGHSSIQWMAPELLSSFDTQPSEKTDIYSLGVVLWELATGKHPYENCDDARVISLVCQGKRLSVQGLPQGWQCIISQCWAQNPGDRPTSLQLMDLLHELVCMYVCVIFAWKFYNNEIF